MRMMMLVMVSMRISLSLTHTITHTHTLTLSSCHLSLSHVISLSVSLHLSLSHTHTDGEPKPLQYRVCCPRDPRQSAAAAIYDVILACVNRSASYIAAIRAAHERRSRNSFNPRLVGVHLLDLGLPFLIEMVKNQMGNNAVLSVGGKGVPVRAIWEGMFNCLCLCLSLCVSPLLCASDL